MTKLQCKKIFINLNISFIIQSTHVLYVRDFKINMVYDSVYDILCQDKDAMLTWFFSYMFKTKKSLLFMECLLNELFYNSITL